MTAGRARLGRRTMSKKTDDHRTTHHRTALLAAAAVLVSMQIVSMSARGQTLWGTHLYAFLPVAAAVVAWSLLAASAWLLLSGRFRPLDDEGTREATLSVAVAFALVCAVIMWVFRSQQTLLGDAVPLMIDLPGGKAFHPRQPIAMWIQQVLYRALGGWFAEEGVSEQEVARGAVAVGSVAAGALFALVAVALGRTLGGVKSLRRTLLVALVLMAQGYAVLLFGYVENYAYYVLLVAVYILAALRYLDGRLPLAFVALAFVVGVGVHLSFVALLPSLVVLIVVAVRDRSRRRDLAIGVMTLVVAAILLDRILGAMEGGYSLWSGLVDIQRIARTSQGGGAGASYLFSRLHLRDFTSELFLVGPLGTLLVIPCAVFALRDRVLRRDPALWFFLAASAAFLAGNAGASEPLLGYARDWDLFAPGAFCYCATVVFVMVRQSSRTTNRLLVFALVLSLVHTVPWVWLGHDEARAIDRFATLPLRGGRTETALGNYYLRADDREKAETWFLRALEEDPTNPNANSLLGRLYGLQGRYDVSAEYLRRAVVVRPDKARLRQDYLLVLLQLKRCDDALPQALWLAQRMPSDIDYWQRLGETMRIAGCVDGLAQVYQPVLAWLDAYARANSGDENADAHAGMMLMRIERFEEAAQRFQRVLVKDPASPSGLYGLGMSLVKLGHTEEARGYLERFVERYPDQPQVDEARAALSATDGER